MKRQQHIPGPSHQEQSGKDCPRPYHLPRKHFRTQLKRCRIHAEALVQRSCASYVSCPNTCRTLHCLHQVPLRQGRWTLECCKSHRHASLGGSAPQPHAGLSFELSLHSLQPALSQTFGPVPQEVCFFYFRFYFHSQPTQAELSRLSANLAAPITRLLQAQHRCFHASFEFSSRYAFTRIKITHTSLWMIPSKCLFKM